MDFKKIIDDFPKRKILVVGDVMLDSYIYGDVERISPEAPVPVVRITKEVYELGGAANVAANISSLGGKAFLLGYVGKDNSKNILINKLNEKNVKFNLYDSLEQTIQKTRIIGNGHQIARIDKEGSKKVSEQNEEELANKIVLENPEIIIASDYAKGCLTNNLFSLIKKYNPTIRIIIDPKPKNKIDYKGAYLITPNLKEGKELTGLEDINEIGKELQKKYNCNVLLTLGKDGSMLFEDKNVISLPTQAKEVFDVTGAGDTLIATIGLGLGSGLNLENSIFLANHAAGIVVGKAGTATISSSELEQVIDSENKKIKSLDELIGICADYKRKGKKIAWTNGCFEILHAGHVNYLKQAKSKGDYLIVGLNSDDSVRALKGESKSIVPQEQRAEVLAGLNSVDYVTIFNEKTVSNCLGALRPDVYAKGGDYDIEKMDQDERKIIESYGGSFAFIPFVNNISTSQIIRKIQGKDK